MIEIKMYSRTVVKKAFRPMVNLTPNVATPGNWPLGATVYIEKITLAPSLAVTPFGLLEGMCQCVFTVKYKTGIATISWEEAVEHLNLEFEPLAQLEPERPRQPLVETMPEGLDELYFKSAAIAAALPEHVKAPEPETLLGRVKEYLSYYEGGY